MSDSIWEASLADTPLIATAIHDGHELRSEVGDLMILPESDRLREEDPFTGPWTEAALTRVIARRSRFEFDLNRPREKAVYRVPEDCWGLEVWREEPSPDLVDRSLAGYDAFYEEMRTIFRRAQERYGHFVVFDLHSYNHRREGPSGPPADPEENPEVNIGTGTMERDRWAPLVDGFIADLSGFDFNGRHLDVRENVKFFGGNLGKWTHKHFPENGCVLSVEFKKFFMDEWTGALDSETHKRILAALRSTVPGVLERARTLAKA